METRLFVCLIFLIGKFIIYVRERFMHHYKCVYSKQQNSGLLFSLKEAIHKRKSVLQKQEPTSPPDKINHIGTRNINATIVIMMRIVIIIVPVIFSLFSFLFFSFSSSRLANHLSFYSIIARSKKPLMTIRSDTKKPRRPATPVQHHVRSSPLYSNQYRDQSLSNSATDTVETCLRYFNRILPNTIGSPFRQ